MYHRHSFLHVHRNLAAVDVVASPLLLLPHFRRLFARSCNRPVLPRIRHSVSRHFSCSPLKAMKVHTSVITTPTSDTGSGSAILLHFDDQRYIFGRVSEGMQRAVIEHSIRTTRVSDLFISGRTEWQTNGGLVGMLLTIADVDTARGTPRPLKAHGSSNLMYTLAATRSFVFRKEMNLEIREFEEQPYYRDGNISIDVLKVEPDSIPAKEDTSYISSSEEEEEEMDAAPDPTNQRKRSFRQYSEESKKAYIQGIVSAMFGSRAMDPTEAGSPEKRARSDEPSTGSLDEPRGPAGLPPTSESYTSLSYICNLHEHRGKFLPDIAKKLGVKPGPNFRELSLGNPVTTASGRVVQPSEVMTAPRPGTGFAVCDLPDVSYLANFIADPHWTHRDIVQQRTGCFFWILGPGVVSDPRFKEFVASFPKSKHVIASPDVCPDKIFFQHAAAANTLLNYLDPVFYPKLYSSSLPSDDLMPEGAISALPGLQWQIEPSWEMKLHTLIEPYNPEAVLNDESNAEFIQSAQGVHKNLAQFEPEVCAGSDVELFTLGTGSALPSPYRNVSATLLRIPGVGSILFDCGENTLGQMKRLFGPEKIKDVLKDLKAVYISHLHADHHLGSVAVLKARSQLIDDNEETFVIGPFPFKVWLKEYSMVEGFGHKRTTFICNNHLLQNYEKPNTKELPRCLEALELESIVTARAKHCKEAYTTAWTFKNGFKIAYSGDTRPTQAFNEIGQDATVLLHEATFEDELIDQAKAKKHSTIGEAIGAGRQMNAWSVVLTHFSQRYPKISLASLLSSEEEEGWAGRKRVIMASDCMRFKVGEIGRFSMLGDALSLLFADKEEETKGNTKSLNKDAMETES